MTQFSKVKTSIISGLDAVPIEVEVKAANSHKPRFIIVGLGDSAIREAKERVLCALQSAGFSVPDSILVNLAPAELRKEGASLDLAIAAAILIASRQAMPQPDIFLHGELSLDASVKPVRGTLAHVITSLEQNALRIVVPEENLEEAQLVPTDKVTSIRHLRELQPILNGESSISLETPPPPTALPEPKPSIIFADVWGQELAKRAMEIAAAGGHNVLLQGPPGCGKSLLARKFPLMLPELTAKEKLEVVKIHSIVGRPVTEILNGRRPLCAPHQGVSQAGLIGGGSTTPTPGDISLAHHGVLFLDELPEYRKSVLESLRGPLETGNVELRRVKYRTTFPANFQLIAAMNRCPCGRLGAEAQTCQCSQVAITAYQQKVSQPIRDRIDLHVTLQGVSPKELQKELATEDTSSDSALKDRIARARQLQISRCGKLNAALDRKSLQKHLALTPDAKKLLSTACERLSLTARTYVRALKVARTIADLKESEHTDKQAVAESLSFRE